MKGDLHGGAYIDAVLNLDALVHNVSVLIENHALLPLTDGQTDRNNVEHYGYASTRIIYYCLDRHLYKGYISR